MKKSWLAYFLSRLSKSTPKNKVKKTNKNNKAMVGSCYLLSTGSEIKQGDFHRFHGNIIPISPARVGQKVNVADCIFRSINLHGGKVDVSKKETVKLKVEVVDNSINGKIKKERVVTIDDENS